jgi:hypothetical protein
VLSTLFIEARVPTPVRPLLLAFTLLFILNPLTLIAGSIRIVINTGPVGLAVEPLTFISVSIC